MGFRVIKTAIATLLAIFIADTAGINGSLSAGLLAILGVDVTRKRSIITVSSRFFASVLGLLLSFAIFYVLGFHIWVLFIYILIAFPVITRANLKEGIVTSSVVVFRVFGGEELSFDIFLTQVWLLVIGLGSAMLVNLIYMPKDEAKLFSIRREVDGLYSQIFAHVGQSLRDPTYNWDGRELLQVSQTIEKGLAIARRSLENQVISPNEAWMVYFYMRKQHLDRVVIMLESISLVYQKIPQAELVATLFDQLSGDVRNEEYTGKTEQLLRELEVEFRNMDLPVTREEFEIRAAILQLCHELDHFLEISKKDKKATASGLPRRI